MSVFNHDYRPYEGRLTPLGSRPLVLARYALHEAWSSKISIGLFVFSLLPCLVELLIIYVADNPIARALILRGQSAESPLAINEHFFLNVLETQCWCALALAAWIAPRLVSFDLGDNALPILLSHPVSRFGYLLGKFLALILSLSYVTWIPCLALFLYQCYASPEPWAMAHLSLGLGIFVGAVIWIVLLSMVGLAVSAWVKWRVIAVGAIFAVVFVPAGVGGIASAILRTKWGIADFRDGDGFGNCVSVVRCGVECTHSCARGGARMKTADDTIRFENVSKFYGEVLGVNRISLSVSPGITTLVGPNGSGKTTLMNLMTGLAQPSRGTISVLGLEPSNATEFFCNVGYCAQFDSFPRGLTGFQFVLDSLMLYGMSEEDAFHLTAEALERVQLDGEASHRKIAGYSKGMRQKIRLAQAIAHHPRVLVLDEPLNGLDPMARAESLALFQELGRQGMHVVISSHILDEVDRISDRVVLITGGYLIAQGNIHEVRREVRDKPMQVLIRCDSPQLLASKMFAVNHCVEARMHADGRGVFLRTGDIDQFYQLLNEIAVEGLVKIDAVAPADDNANAIYQYLIGSDGSAS
jgi:ABC-2 type transport system ATP-binding protein